MTVAAIDVGTNSVRMLVREGSEQRSRTLEITRLGQGVDAARNLHPDAIARTISAIARFVNEARALHADSIVIAATSAVRDSRNRSEFVQAVRERTGIEPRVLSGSEEATLSFTGAALSFDPSVMKVVIDIGGGSTELVAGRSRVRASCSTDAGSVRLTERHIKHDPADPAEIEAVRNEARALISAGAAHLAKPLEGASVTLIGVAGTFTTLTGLCMNLDRYDQHRIHRATLRASDIASAIEMLQPMTIAERGLIPVVTPGRADVIVSGAIIAEQCLQAFHADSVRISETDILDGLIASL